MITTNLFEEVLLKPVEDGADHLLIVSGYATSAMAFRHLDDLRNTGREIKIDLIVGMCSQDGLSLSNHRGFQKIVNEEFVGRFRCSYLYKRPPVHSKVYIWLKGDKPFRSFIGSANYSQFAFSRFQREALTPSDPGLARKYFDQLECDTVYCQNLEVSELVTIYSDKQYRQRFERQIDTEKDEIAVMVKQGGTGDEALQCVTVSLLSKGKMPSGASGLNWGVRPGRKDRNAAYIQLPPNVYRSDFFPANPTEFTVLTDDGKSLHCGRKSKDEDGQQITTPRNNQLLGEYFRNRLGVASGDRVTKEDLERYGRTTVTFCKIDDETFEMDFSV